ncbi:hypothetical protein F4803DRAFT_544047 [Xylaria telfairii]|nr:hypothetical protein F4803DRAFT_544047 [Xylaria telfairii]
MSSNHFSYECCNEGGLFTRHELQHLFKPHFWIAAALILYLYIFDKSNPGATSQVTKSRLAAYERPQPRSQAKQIGGLAMSLGILGLVWMGEYMILSIWWRVAPKVLFAWRPSLMPLRPRLLMLYPAWVVISALCIAAVALVVTASTHINQVQLGCISEKALLVMGRKELNSRVLGANDGSGDRERVEERKVSEMEDARVCR